MIGDQIYTNFTPLTSANLDLTVCAWTTRRIACWPPFLVAPGEPNCDARTDDELMGGHGFRYDGKLRLGLTFMNAHNARPKKNLPAVIHFLVCFNGQNQPLQIFG